VPSLLFALTFAVPKRRRRNFKVLYFVVPFEFVVIICSLRRNFATFCLHLRRAFYFLAVPYRFCLLFLWSTVVIHALPCHSANINGSRAIFLGMRFRLSKATQCIPLLLRFLFLDYPVPFKYRLIKTLKFAFPFTAAVVFVPIFTHVRHKSNWWDLAFSKRRAVDVHIFRKTFRLRGMFLKTFECH
jgi:hypothetical protein